MSPKAKGKRGHRETVKPLSGLDVDSLLDREERQKISPDNAIPEFKQMVNTTRGGDEDIANAMAQMSKITRDLISTTVGDNNYEMALQNMAVMREEMIGLEVPEVYNEFFQDLKRRIVEKDGLGGDRRDFWFQTKPRKLGLIHNKVSEVSDISEEEANEVGDGRCNRDSTANFAVVLFSKNRASDSCQEGIDKNGLDYSKGSLFQGVVWE